MLTLLLLSNIIMYTINIDSWWKFVLHWNFQYEHGKATFCCHAASPNCKVCVWDFKGSKNNVIQDVISYTVYRTIQCFKKTPQKTVKDRPRSGYPRTATTQKTKKKIASRIATSPQKSMKKLVAKIEVSKEFVRQVVKRDLRHLPLKPKNVHYLMDACREERPQRTR